MIIMREIRRTRVITGVNKLRVNTISVGIHECPEMTHIRIQSNTIIMSAGDSYEGDAGWKRTRTGELRVKCQTYIYNVQNLATNLKCEHFSLEAS